VGALAGAGGVGSGREPSDLDPSAFPVADVDVRGFRQVFTHDGRGGVPLLLVHGWPETRRIWWRVIDRSSPPASR
jgi:pimeloyl-ACP methyl ester carboxylesterase